MVNFTLTKEKMKGTRRMLPRKGAPKMEIKINETSKEIAEERTFEDVKRHFQKMLELIKTMENSETPSPFRKENT